MRYKYHSTVVWAWIEKSGEGLQSKQLLELFKSVLNRLASRAKTTVSEVTLDAVFDRVLYNTSELYPIILDITYESSHFDFLVIQKNSKSYTEAQIKDAFHYLISEFLVIMGNLTAEQLTPFLHGELTSKPQKGSTKKDKK